MTTSQPEEFSSMRVIRLSREAVLKAAALAVLVGVVIPIPILWITLGDEVVGPRTATPTFALFRAAYMLGVLACAAANVYLWIVYRRGEVGRWLGRTRTLRARAGLAVLTVAALWVGVKGVNYLSAILASPSLKLQPVSLGGTQVRWIDLLNLVVLAVFVVDLTFILTVKVVTLYGGG